MAFLRDFSRLCAAYFPKLLRPLSVFRTFPCCAQGNLRPYARCRVREKTGTITRFHLHWSQIVMAIDLALTHRCKLRTQKSLHLLGCVRLNRSAGHRSTDPERPTKYVNLYLLCRVHRLVIGPAAVPRSCIFSMLNSDRYDGIINEGVKLCHSAANQVNKLIVNHLPGSAVPTRILPTSRVIIRAILASPSTNP